MLKQLVKTGLLIAAAGMAQHIAIRIATAERGYQAMGGEFFVFPLICLVGYYALGLARYDRMREEEDDDERIIDLDQYRNERKSKNGAEERRM